MSGEPNYWTNVLKRRISRRKILAGGLGLAGATIVGCNNELSSPTRTSGATTSSGPTPTRVPPTAAPASQIQRGGRLVFNWNADPSNLDPHLGTVGWDYQYETFIYDPIIRNNEKGVPDPNLSLCEKWDFQETTLTFTLRKGVKFHDGTELDAEAAKFNYDRIMDPANKSSGLASFAAVKSVEVVDKYTFKFNMNYPSAPLISSALPNAFGFMVSPTQVKKVGNEQFAKQPIGTGPFMLSEWVPNSHVLLKKNPNYWLKDSTGGQTPYLDEVKIVMVADPLVALAGLQSGDIDITQISPLHIDDLKKNSSFGTLSYIQNPVSVVICNPALPPADDNNFRQAVGWGINPDEINQKIYQGKMKPMLSGFWPSDSPYADPNVTARPKFDLAKAKEFLSKSKYNGAEIPMLTFNIPAVLQSAELAQAQLKAVGINVRLDVRETAQASALWNEGKTYPIYYAMWMKAIDPDNTASYLLYSKGYGNAGKMPNPELDDLIKKGAQTYDVAKRREIYRQINEIMYGQGYAFPYLESVTFVGYNKRVQNYDSPWFSFDFGWRPWLAWIKK